MEVLKLQTTNEKQFSVEIPYDQLCNTFKDAIIITKGLGLGYLWSMPFQLIMNHLAIDMWCSMVETYTLSNLTYERDRLVAFSGVAKWFQRRKADDDFAGMWKLDLEEQLCWKRSQDSYLDYKDYIAPTWS